MNDKGIKKAILNLIKKGLESSAMFNNIKFQILIHFLEEYDFAFKEDNPEDINLINCLKKVKEKQDKDKSDITQALKYFQCGSTKTGIQILENILGEGYKYKSD